MTLLAEAFLLKTGMNLSDFAAIHLFGPPGITDYDWERFENGGDAGGWGPASSLRIFSKSAISWFRAATGMASSF